MFAAASSLARRSAHPGRNRNGSALPRGAGHASRSTPIISPAAGGGIQERSSILDQLAALRLRGGAMLLLQQPLQPSVARRTPAAIISGAQRTGPQQGLEALRHATRIQSAALSTFGACKVAALRDGKLRSQLPSRCQARALSRPANECASATASLKVSSGRRCRWPRPQAACAFEGSSMAGTPRSAPSGVRGCRLLDSKNQRCGKPCGR